MLFIENYNTYTINGIFNNAEDILDITITENTCKVIEPSYTGIIPPMQLRRMTKPIRIGVAAVKQLLQTLPIDVAAIRAINIGTAYGLLTDSEQFLKQVIDQNEQTLTPTAFIQSTHNTVGGAIALSIGSNAHNMTYVHKGHSVALALLDIILMAQDDIQQQYYIVGGIDELTNTADTIIKNITHQTTSEGAAFLVIGNQKTQAKAVAIIDNQIYFDCANIIDVIDQMMAAQHMNETETYFVIGGSLDTLPYTHTFNYNAICGLYPTMHATGICFGANILEHHPNYKNAITITLYEKYLSITVLQG